MSRPFGAAAIGLENTPRSARQRFPVRDLELDRAVGSSTADQESSTRSGRLRTWGLERGRRPLPRPGAEVRGRHCPGGPRPSRRGAPPDSQSRQSARRPRPRTRNEDRAQPVRSGFSRKPILRSRLYRAARPYPGSQPRPCNPAIRLSMAIENVTLRGAALRRKRSDRSGAFLEALRGAHHRGVSVSGALRRASPGCGTSDGLGELSVASPPVAVDASPGACNLWHQKATNHPVGETSRLSGGHGIGETPASCF